MKNSRLLLVGGLVLALALLAWAGERERFDHSVPLENADKVELQLDLSLAETHLMAGDDEPLVRFHGQYDSRDMEEPTIDIDRSGSQAFLHIESRADKELFGSDNSVDDGGDFTIELSPRPEYAIRAEVGLGENNLDLTGLKIGRLHVEAGLAETNLTIDEPNSVRAERVVVECGLGEVDTDRLGNLRFDRLSVDVGMGDMTLDLRGYEGDGQVDVNVGMGSCTIIVPRGVGVRAYYSGGFMSSVDLRELRRMDDDLYVSDDIGDAEHTLEFELDVGMGDIDLRWD